MNGTNNYEQTAMHVSRVTLIGNAVLSLLKLAAGILARSSAMVSDSIHSASDVLSTFVVMAGIRMAGREADKEHPYGHERLECVASILLAMVLALVGVGIGYGGVMKILQRNEAVLEAPGLLALIASIVSIVVKEAMYQYTASAAKKIKSSALMADAWHHRSDAFSSVGALIGIAGARMGLPILDPIASVVICLFIIKAAFDIFMDAVDKMVDHSCSEEDSRAILDVVLREEGVLGVDSLKTRMFGAKIYVDAEISVDGSMTLSAAHAIAERVHDRIEESFPEVKHCMVHVNPAEEEK